MYNINLDFIVEAGYAVAPVTPARDSDIDHRHVSKFDMTLPFMDSVVGGAIFMCVAAIGMLCWYCAKMQSDSARLNARLEAIAARMEAGMDRESAEMDLMTQDDQPSWYLQARGLQQSLIDAIKVVKYEKGGGLVEGNECAICLSEFEEYESLRVLPKCAHAFHIPCVDQWFSSHSNCPLCRSPITHAMIVAGVPLFTPAVLEWAKRSRLEQANRAALGGQQPDEIIIDNVNNSQVTSHSDSSESENGNSGLIENKDPSVSGSRKRKAESDPPTSYVENEFQLIGRSVSIETANALKMDETVAEIKIQVNSDSSHDLNSLPSGCSSIGNSPDNNIARSVSRQ